MISPLGTILTTFETGSTSAVTSMVGLISQQIPGPLGVGLVGLFIYQGVQVATGDKRPLRDLAPWMAGFAIVFWMITTPSQYLYYVRDVMFTGFPATLIAAATGTGTLGTPTSVATTINSLWAQVWQMSADAGKMSPTSIIDVAGNLQSLAALILACFASAALFVCMIVYELSRFFLCIEIVIGPVLLACHPFPALRHYTHSWLGVGVSLMLAELGVFVTAQIALLACQPLMAQMTNEMVTAMGNAGSMADALQTMVAMGFVLWSAASAVVVVPTVCFFIGRGGGSPLSVPNPLR